MDLIDPREIAKRHSFAEHAERADTYFRPFPFECRLLHKPFMSDAEAAEICAGLGVLLPHLHLFAGVRVLDFGAGTCWLSRALALLGCEVTALDVSQHALDLGRRLIQSDPLAANMRVSFVKLDSERLPFDDSVFERVICFDALHHVPDQERMIAEFARVLRPGGIAAFHEPGPHHSRAVQSQHEMRMHGVIEGDIDVPALERAGRGHGFTDCKVALFGPMAEMLSPQTFEALIAHDADAATAQRAMQNMRTALQGKRIFFMHKGDWRAHLDSRSHEGLHGSLELDAELTDGGVLVRGRASNTGSTTWLPSAADPGGVRLGVHLHDAQGRLLQRGYHYALITERALPSEQGVDIHATIPLPQGHDKFSMTFDLVASEVSWFEMRDSKPLVFDVDRGVHSVRKQETVSSGAPMMAEQQKKSKSAVGEDAVKWAYRMLLGREPENEQVVVEQSLRHPDIRALRASVMGSDEFIAAIPGTIRFPLRGLEPASSIDCEGSPQKMEKLFAHVNRSWHALGDTDPFYSVLTAPEYHGVPVQESVARFFESGLGDAERFLKTLERNNLDFSERPVCLEYGCGLGRITRALAPHFSKTIGVDISASHLTQAQRLAREANVTDDIEWLHLASVGALDRLPKVDVIYSMIVLQHNPPPIIDRIVSTFARILKPGGIAYFQVPTYVLGYSFVLDDYLHAIEGHPGMEMHVYPQSKVFSHFAQENAIPVSVVEDEATNMHASGRSNTFLFLRNG